MMSMLTDTHEHERMYLGVILAALCSVTTRKLVFATGVLPSGGNILCRSSFTRIRKETNLFCDLQQNLYLLVTGEYVWYKFDTNVVGAFSTSYSYWITSYLLIAYWSAV